MSVAAPAALVKDDAQKPTRYTVYGRHTDVLSAEGVRLLASVVQAVTAGTPLTLDDWSFVRSAGRFVPADETHCDLFVHGRDRTTEIYLSTSAVVLADTTRGWILTKSGTIYALGAHSADEDPWQQLFNQ